MLRECQASYIACIAGEAEDQLGDVRETPCIRLSELRVLIQKSSFNFRKLGWNQIWDKSKQCYPTWQCRVCEKTWEKSLSVCNWKRRAGVYISYSYCLIVILRLRSLSCRSWNLRLSKQIRVRYVCLGKELWKFMGGSRKKKRTARYHRSVG